MAYKKDGSRFRQDQIFETKIDVGVPGSGGGLDVGEGGSYTTDPDGTIVVKAFIYDASADSGSRFTELTDLGAQNQLLGDVGDRLYIGCDYKFWASRFEIGIAKVGGTQILKYSKGAAMANIASSGGMVVLKDTANAICDVWLEQTVEKEYIAHDKAIDGDWVKLDNVLDDVPNTGTPLYWIAYEVPTGGWSVAPRVDEIKVRGSDFDVISGTAFPVFWGRARVAIHDRIDLGEGSGGSSATIAISSTQSLEGKRMRSGNTDPITRLFQLPAGIDTSCSLKITLDYSANSAINTADIKIDIKKLNNDTAIGAGEASDLTETANINVVASGKVYTNYQLNSTLLDVSDLCEGDSLSIKIERADSNGGDFYPLTLSIHYVIWTTGEHV